MGQELREAVPAEDLAGHEERVKAIDTGASVLACARRWTLLEGVVRGATMPGPQGGRGPARGGGPVPVKMAPCAECGTYVVPGHGRVYEQLDVVEYRDMVAIIRDRVAQLAVRAVGLDAGPMGGFSKPGIDHEFFGDGPVRSLLVVNIGHAAADGTFPRSPRLERDEVFTTV